MPCNDDNPKSAEILLFQAGSDYPPMAMFMACDMEGHGYWETGQYADALESWEQQHRVIELFMRSDEICLESYLWCGMQSNHWGVYLQEAACLVKLGRSEQARERIDRAAYILLHAWVQKDGAVDYLAQAPEKYIEPFRRYYGRWGLDGLVECPV